MTSALDTMQSYLNRTPFPVYISGNPGLVFVNTIEHRAKDKEYDRVPNYMALLAFCWGMGALSDDTAAALYAEAEANPGAAQQALQQAVGLREALWRIGGALFEGLPLPADDMALVNGELARLLPLRRLRVSRSEIEWTWQMETLDSIWGQLLFEATELLASPTAEKIRRCPGCGWLFVDTSRNHSRRWCSMDFCGSKAKSRRQYERRKSNAG